jgi:hypothetical protein
MHTLKIKVPAYKAAIKHEANGETKVGDLAERIAEQYKYATPHGATFYLNGLRLDPDWKLKDQVPQKGALLTLWISS